MTTDTLDLLTVGETMGVLVVGSLPDETGSFGDVFVGGAESNVAMLAARFGHRSGWAGAVGDDAIGDCVLQDLADSGVDVSLVRRDPDRPTGVYARTADPSRARTTYYRRGSAASALSRSNAEKWGARRPRIVHLTGILPALSPSCADLAEALIVDRVLGKCVVSFDVNHRPQLWDGTAAQTLLHLANHADVVFVGRDEAEGLWGTGTADYVRDLIATTGDLVVKDAEIEAVAFSQRGRIAEAALPVDVVDVVGAGDAFAAGWLSGLLGGVGERRRLQLAHWAARQALATRGDTPQFPSLPHALDAIRHTLETETTP